MKNYSRLGKLSDKSLTEYLKGWHSPEEDDYLMAIGRLPKSVDRYTSGWYGYVTSAAVR